MVHHVSSGCLMEQLLRFGFSPMKFNMIVIVCCVVCDDTINILVIE